MKTKKFYSVEIVDNTCNTPGRETGIYGKEDYSWINESLNGGCDAEYGMTEEEANSVKSDFERIIKERGLEWASARVVSVDVPFAETLQDVADYYNENPYVDVAELERMIEDAGFVSDCDSDWYLCHKDNERVMLQDNGEAVVVRDCAKYDFYLRLAGHAENTLARTLEASDWDEVQIRRECQDVLGKWQGDCPLGVDVYKNGEYFLSEEVK